MFFNQFIIVRKLKIGLLGGSFNPPHYGHLYITQEAIKRLDLDCVWWLVVSHNPLKFDGGYSIEDRVTLSLKLVAGCPRIRVIKMTECYSYNVVTRLCKKFVNIKFVWLMGDDNLFSFHCWYRWKTFCKLLPIVVFERSKNIYRCLGTPFVSYMRNAYCTDFQLLLNCKYGWMLIRLMPCNISSSQIRGYTLNKI
ncbi:nicotinate-nicotinamide nucleotide adenylyltransferase [Ehrlichia minasensis]|uniref:nicotinate-nucleotide adenylyltransferase n=1 Tax=Ehrlichia minasensis TaxID=1242993 RepID=A0A4Q6I341_9RICK|nr:nicotinate-nicotinamide nucleotide adenylyltransferase [Ehrlichia minasensis]CEI84673.1 Cytidyl transferase-related domain [Ehrlichia minasensis]